MNRLHKLQKRALRVLCDAKYNAPTRDLFNNMYIMPLPDRILYKNTCMVYKSLNNLSPPYIENMFTKIMHGRSTRSKTQELLQVSATKKEFYKKSFIVNGAKQWNNLDFYLRSSSSLEIFKRTYFKKYWEKLLYCALNFLWGD